MNTIGILLGLFIFVNLLDRLRLVNWRTARPAALVLLLLCCAISLAAIYEGFRGELAVWHLVGLMPVLGWLHVTRPEWRHNTIPPWARSDRVDLDDRREQESAL